jgi:PAS domain S-box-containing protein
MRTEPLAAINSLALAIGSFDSLQGMLQYALAKVLEVVEADAAGVYLLDEERGHLTFAAQQGLSDEATHDFDALPVGEGLSGRVALEGIPMVLRNLQDHPRLTRMAARAEGIRAFASVPLRFSHKTYGTLNIYSHEEREFGEGDVQLLTSMASQIGMAVANTRLFLQLQASERKFRSLVESAKDLIYLTGSDGCVTYINPAASSRLGREPHDLCGEGHLLLSLVVEDDRPKVAAALQRTLDGEVLAPFEFRMLHADGSIRWFAHTMLPFRNESGTVVGVHGIAYDRTRRREMEAQIARGERLADLGRMAATIAHEIRNPLGAIVNSINLLRDPGERPDPVLLDIVGEEADRLDAIIRDFLLFARPPARSLAPTDVATLVQATVTLFRQDKKLASDVEVIVTGGADLPLATVDQSQLRQVIWNLLANAADVSLAGGRIDVRIEHFADADALAIEIVDDGPGVGDVDTIFEPFYTTKAQGTGLGLAVTSRIVRDHGGTIRVTRAAGRGACFTVSLPVSPAAITRGH